MKLFTISSYGSDFSTGVTEDGRLAVMGLLCPWLVVVYFGAEGEFLSHESIALTMPPPQMGVERISWETENGTQSVDGIQPGRYRIYDPAFRKSLDDDLTNLRRQIGFIEQPIRVQQFNVETDIGIDLLPEHLADFKADPDSIAEDVEERGYLQEDLDEWEKAGNFVLWWGKDYWFGPDGEVEST